MFYFSACPIDWNFFQGACYRVFTDDVLFADAEANCVELGGHLASIHSVEENDFILGNFLSALLVLLLANNQQRWQKFHEQFDIFPTES